MKHPDYSHPEKEAVSRTEEIMAPAKEIASPAMEFSPPPEEYFQQSAKAETAANNSALSKEENTKKKERRKLLRKMVQLSASATLAVVTINAAAPPASAIPEAPAETIVEEPNLPIEETPPPVIEIPPEEETGDMGDESFPELPNLEPVLGIPEPNSSGMSEEFIRFFGDDGIPVYLIAGDVWGATPQELPGAEYDLSTNTLTLNNFTGPMLDVNLMGNGFTICLIGDNYLDYIRVWGWAYGGSLTITGSGSLTVNDSGKNEIGIELNGEGSQTCLMVDNQATLDVKGSVIAIYVYNSKIRKTLYYLSPSTLTGGVRDYRTFTVNVDGNEVSFDAYTVVDEDGMPAKHVTIKP